MLIEVKNLSKIYGFGSATTVALDNVSLNIEKSEFVAIMGPSGSGKSTLMHILGLLDQPTHGDLLIDRQDMIDLNQKQKAQIRRQKIGFVFQAFNLLPRLSAIENVALPLTYSGLSHVKQLKKAEDMLKKVNLEDRQYYMPNQLSGGQIQRVAIARALINNPTMILADEPTGNLDSVSSQSVMELLQALNKQGHTIIIVTHDQDVASFANRIIRMIDGRIEDDSFISDQEKSATKKSRTPKKRKPKTTRKKATKKTSKKKKDEKEAKE